MLTRLGVMPLSAVTAAITAGRAAVPARSAQQTLKPAVVVPARRKREDEGESEDTVYYVDLAKREGIDMPWSERFWKTPMYDSECIDRRSRSPDAGDSERGAARRNALAQVEGHQLAEGSQAGD
jgi:hypothetical protein